MSAALITGCSLLTPAPSAAERPRRDAPPSGDPAISAAGSQRVINGYVARQNAAVSRGDGRAWRDGTAGPLKSIAATEVRLNQGRPAERGQISLVAPLVHVPRLTGYPRWFATIATEQRKAPEGATQRPTVLLFVQSAENARWLVAYKLYLPRKARPPRPETDDQGYATLAAGAKLPVSADRLPTAHAGYLQTGQQGALFAAGPYTTGWRDSAARAGSAARTAGWRTEVAVAPEGSPYALRAAGGGALVWYALRETETLTGAPPASVPADARGYLAGRTGNRIQVHRMLLVLAQVRPKGSVQVLGATRALVKATVG